MLCSDPAVKAILVNIFGGIVNCATVANGIVSACKTTKLEVPLVVRLEGVFGGTRHSHVPALKHTPTLNHAPALNHAPTLNHAPHSLVCIAVRLSTWWCVNECTVDCPFRPDCSRCQQLSLSLFGATVAMDRNHTGDELNVKYTSGTCFFVCYVYFKQRHTVMLERVSRSATHTPDVSCGRHSVLCKLALKLFTYLQPTIFTHVFHDTLLRISPALCAYIRGRAWID